MIIISFKSLAFCVVLKQHCKS